LYFFFSSRRRHTRSKRDWSSDVCSSDLSAAGKPLVLALAHDPLHVLLRQFQVLEQHALELAAPVWTLGCLADPFQGQGQIAFARSEERRVGKEWRCGWAGDGVQR